MKILIQFFRAAVVAIALSACDGATPPQAVAPSAMRPSASEGTIFIRYQNHTKHYAQVFILAGIVFKWKIVHENCLVPGAEWSTDTAFSTPYPVVGIETRVKSVQDCNYNGLEANRRVVFTDVSFKRATRVDLFADLYQEQGPGFVLCGRGDGLHLRCDPPKASPLGRMRKAARNERSIVGT